ncbi:MAG: Trehalose 6-phosphate phosphatase [Solirubrobacterales bacterium]|nr:Trehalose 6-phosphate phosphatase [Solirubrobacterales bacterium]
MWIRHAAILSAVSGKSETTRAAWQTLLEPLRAEPARTAILTDFDGTLAPIVEHTEDASLPDGARDLLVRLTERYALVGAISGRRTADVRALIGLDTIAYAGNHGLELMMPGDREVSPDPSLAGREGDAAEFVATVEAGRLDEAGLRIEDKGPIQAIHWRGVADEAAAEAAARVIAVDAGRAGLEPRWGRKVLELRPVGGGGKDAAVASLLASDGLDRVVYAGDDRTDVDAFRRLGELREAGELVAAVRVGVLSAEGPPQIAEEADVTVDDPAGWLEMLAWLAE